MNLFIYAQENSTNEIKIINYNTLYGFNHKKAINEGIEWIKNQNPDVVFLTEMKGYDPTSIKNMGLKWGHTYTHFWKRKGAAMPLVVTSNQPISAIKEVKTTKQHKGFLMCKTHGYGFVLVHLHPNNVKHRKNESKVLLTELESWDKSNIPYTILGDFNAMSIADMQYYNQNLKLSLQEKIAKKKCGDLKNCKDWDYSVMEVFFKHGLKDVHYLKSDQEEQDQVETFYGTFPSTVLEKITKQNQKKYLQRIDYFLSNHLFYKNIRDCHVGRDPILEKISDHYPIITRVLKAE